MNNQKLNCIIIRGKIIELKGRGHYTFGDMGTEEFPELLEEIIK